MGPLNWKVMMWSLGLLAATIGLAVVTLGPFSAARAADPCPAGVTEAKVALTNVSRSEQDMRASKLSKADGPVHEAEVACEQGAMTMANRKAQEALDLLKGVHATGRQGVEARVPPSAKVPGPTRPSESDYH